jgi:uracil-DNA glycosylase
MAVDPETFYDQSRIAIVPMGFCFPGQNARGADLPPRKECAPAWQARIFAHLPSIRLILAVGAHAQRWHLGPLASRSLTETVAAWRDIVATTHPMVVPLPHPSWRNNAWLTKHPWFETDLLPFLRSAIAERLD